MRTPRSVTDVLEVATARAHRSDPTLARTGGPAGNAQLTAWLGLALLVLFVAEAGTLLDIAGLISWHITIGLLLIPPSLAKTATTGWRILRYYTGHGSYRRAGPPPVLLRLLGPLVILGTSAVLASGTLLIGVGPTAAFRPWFAILGHGFSPLTLHQGSAILWAGATALHLLARFVPALRLVVTGGRHPAVPGLSGRVMAVIGTAAAAGVTAILVLDGSGAWTHGTFQRFDTQPDVTRQVR